MNWVALRKSTAAQAEILIANAVEECTPGHIVFEARERVRQHHVHVAQTLGKGFFAFWRTEILATRCIRTDPLETASGWYRNFD